MRRRYADKLAFIVKSTPASRQIRDPFEPLYATGLAIEPPLPPEKLLVLAEENAIHAACIRAKADDAVGRGWRLVGDEDAESYEEVAEILEQITPDLTFAELLNQAAWELEAIGWAAWEVVRQDGKIAAIYPMPAHTVRATKDPTIYLQIRGIEQREFVLFGQPHDEDTSEIIFFRYYTPRSPYYGLPRWISAIPALAELTAIREYNISWFASGGMADRIITVTAPTTTEASKLAEEIRTALREATGRGHVSIILAASRDTDVGVRFLSSQGDRHEGQFTRRREDLVKEVLMAHGVPPYRIGWAEIGSLGGSAAREMLRAYRLGVIEPIQTILESRLNQTLFGPNGLNLKARWKLEDVDWEETELNLDLATKGIQYGILTPNEARQILGREVVDDEALDQYYLSQNLKPLGPRNVQEAVDVLREFKAALEAALRSGS